MLQSLHYQLIVHASKTLLKMMLPMLPSLSSKETRVDSKFLKIETRYNKTDFSAW